jgi:hypothetical protein
MSVLVLCCSWFFAVPGDLVFPSLYTQFAEIWSGQLWNALRHMRMLEKVWLALALWRPQHKYSSVARGKLVLASSLFEPSPDLYPQLVSAVSLRPRARFSLFIIFVYAENYSFRGPSHPILLSFPLLGWLEPFLQSRRERFYSGSCS